ENVKISKTVKTISSTAFSGCGKITNIELDKENTNFTFKDGILLGNNNSEMIIILQSAIKNGNTFIVPDTVTTLADRQLIQFTNITTLEIPASVTNISPRFISYNITQVKIDNENKNYETYENGIYTKDGKKLIRYYGNDNTVKVKDGVEIISEHSFEGKNLSEVELPESIKNIQ